MSRGVVAAGHPATAEAGAWALREGGNAVDAAVAAVCASIVAESPLTGLGAGGHMLVHRPGGETVLLDFFVAAPGLGGHRAAVGARARSRSTSGTRSRSSTSAPPPAGCRACRAGSRRRRDRTGRCRSPIWWDRARGSPARGSS